MSNFIAKATANSHGQFSAKAKAAGKSTLEFAHEHAGDKGKLGKQARLAETLIGLGKHRKKSAAEKMYPGHKSG